MTNKKPSSEIQRLVNAFGYSLAGLKSVSGHPAFRIELIVSLVAIPVAFFVTHVSAERALLVGSIMLVLIVELLNTGIEKCIDRISPEWHELSKQAKDIASAAVLLSIFNAGLVWLIIVFF